MPDVVLLGDINIDIISSLPAYPAWGAGGIASAVEYHTGGSVVNTSVALAKMGVAVGLVGRVGKDALANQALQDLDKAGIDRSQIQIDATVSTGLIYVVVTPDGERTMFSSRGANVFTEVTAELDTYLASARWYHFSGYTLLAQPQQATALAGLDIAKQHHCRVSLDPGPDPVMQLGKQIKKLLEKVDIFFPNERELQLLADSRTIEDSAKELLDNGAKAIVIKRGKEGCVAAFEKKYYEIPAFEIQARDTTGAGDTFNAGVILGRMVGLSWPASCILGNALGAVVSMEKGSGASQVTTHSVIELISSQQFRPQWAAWQGAIEEVLAWL